MNYKRILLCIEFTISLTYAAQAQSGNTAYWDYIREYASIAVSEQAKFGIPASITLAQGLLESGAGQSELARLSNNHFGIKCHTGWTGERTYYDDDARNECFRKYKHVSQSYDDHSLFLTSRPRYADLFKLKPTDYKGWAHGLKKAGYATDPNYAYKLIKIIEDYGLHQLDINGKLSVNNQRPTTSTPSHNYALDKRNKGAQTATKQPVNRKKKISPMGSVLTYTPHPIAKINGIRYVIAEAGDSYASIANEFDLTEADLLRYNDLSQTSEITPGEWIYLRPKKVRASKDTPFCHVQSGESARDIAQRYGIRLKKLYDLNRIPYNQSVRVGQALKLR